MRQRDVLEDEERARILARLARLDRAAANGPWTVQVLRLVEQRPAARAADLAAEIGRETAQFKLDVRKLKAMGLTESLDIGYQLSPRGIAVLRSLEPDP